MTFRDWLRRELASRPSGTLDLELPARSGAPALVIALRGVIAAAVLAIVVTTLLQFPRPRMTVSGLVVYLVIAFVLRPRPDLRNLEPRALSWSDNDDRGLLLLRVVLAPGRALGSGLKGALELIVGSRPG